MVKESEAAGSRVAVAAVHGLTILLGAFLLFQVQPLIARYVLPWFGGSPAVWTTCLLFFQVLLLAGYAYAHLLGSRRPRTQLLVHAGLLTLGVATLPILPDAGLAPHGAEDPTLQVLVILAASVGLPYLALATTGPLVQRWFSVSVPGGSPYRLFALSNAGSLLGLITYPLAVEPLLTRGAQAWVWSTGFAVQALAFVACAAIMVRAAGSGRALASSEASLSGSEASPSPEGSRWWLWLALPACASALLMAVTNQITLEVVAVPFLWVLPLSLYLISFIICFDHSRWYRRAVWLAALIVGLEAAWAALGSEHLSLPVQVLAHCGALFAGAMACHGELHRLKPVAERLTAFYLCIALGGALGGVFVAIVAPLVFDRYLELHVSLVATGLLVAFTALRGAGRPGAELPAWARPVTLVALGVLTIGLWHDARSEPEGLLHVERGFHGVLRIVERDAGDERNRRRVLMHGPIDHGFQFLGDKALTGVAYYNPESGIGRALARPGAADGRRVGVVGLGVGVVAAYCRPGESWTFYELHPAVARMAEEEFTYLEHCEAGQDIVLGDARLALERSEPEGFDVLLVDAFSGDAVPVHLLTREAFALYGRHLGPAGTLALHVTNRHLDLTQVAVAGAAALGPDASTWTLRSRPDGARGWYEADYVLVTRDATLETELAAAGAHRVEAAVGEPWTDDYSNLLAVLKRAEQRR